MNTTALIFMGFGLLCLLVSQLLKAEDHRRSRRKNKDFKY